MKNIIKIEDLTFRYKDKEIFKNLNIEVQENTFTTILGANGSGKTTLVKLILGLEKPSSVIIVNNLPVIKENLKRIYKSTSTIFENQDKSFVAETVTDELAFSLENLNYTKDQIEKEIEKISKKLNIKHLLEKEPYSLNTNNKSLVALASALITQPKLLIIDNSLNNLNETEKEKILKLLKEMTQTTKLTVLYLTHNPNDSLYSDNIIILENKKVLISGPKEEVYKNEKNFEIANLELPFIIELSKKLQFYNLIDKDYLETKKMVDDLWK